MTTDPTTPYPHLPPPPPGPLRPEPVRTTPALNTVWLAVGSFAAVFGLVLSTLQVVGVLAHEEHDETIRIADPAVAVLDVSTAGGAVEVVGADVDDIRIQARVSDGLVATDFTQEVVGDRLRVRVRCVAVIANAWCGARLRIVVPRSLEVKVRSHDDSVTVRGISGRVDADSSNGSVEAESLSGATLLRSDNGTVRASRLRTESIEASSGNGSVRLEFAAAPSSAIARSDNGSVEVAVPRDESRYDVVVESDNGSTESLVRTDPESTRRIVATSSNGSVTVRYLD